MKLTINGDVKEVTGAPSLESMISGFGMKPDRIAVELNRTIIQRSEWKATLLQDGDKIEIVHFVGGGSKPSIAHFPPAG